jgi:nitrile hydratase subunit alpha
MKPETDPMPRASEPSHDHNHWELSPIELRVRALEFMQVEKGYVEPALLMPSSQRAVKISPPNGAQVVARAGRQFFLQASATGRRDGGDWAGFSIWWRQAKHLTVVENSPARA